MTKDEVLEQALGVLERINGVDNDCNVLSDSLSEALTEVIEAIEYILQKNT